MDGARIGKGVARDARGGLTDLEQVVRCRAVRHMAIAAVLGDRRMFVDPGTHHFLMATRALGRACPEAAHAFIVGRVAIGAVEHALFDRMVGGQPEFGHDSRMTARTEPSRIGRMAQQGHVEVRGRTQLRGLAIVGVVAIAAQHIG